MELLLLVLLVASVESKNNTDGVECESSPFPFFCGGNSCDIRRRLYCDGTPQCADGSDEIVYNKTLHDGKGMNCTRKENNTCFLPSEYLCDHEIDCIGGGDECNCESTFYCDDGDCALKITFCDGKNDCQDGTDERSYNRTKGGFQCQVSKRHVTLSCSLPDVHVCDGSSDCNWGIDECFCDKRTATSNFVNDRCFRCLDRTLVIPSNHVCDGVFHCKDLSDECLCSANEQRAKNTIDICEKVCAGDQCPCPGKLRCKPRASDKLPAGTDICLEPESICNDIFDCAEGFDEDHCPFVDEFFSCLDGSQKVRKNVVCDGISHCQDGSDEKGCHESKYVCDVYRNHTRNGNWTHLLNWTESSPPPLNRETVEADLKKIIGKPWQYFYPYYTDQCDGVPLCAYGKDECNCAERHGFCDFVINQTLKCPNSQSLLSGHEVCDGQPTCNDTAPHESEDEKGCPNRFYCANNGLTRLPIHIPEENRCDGRAECDDQSDELDCPNTTHFYCTKGGSTLFISVDQVCDKRKDCKGGEDECADCSNDPYSSDDRLIRSRVLIGFLWIIGLTSASGNLAIIFHQIVNIYKLRNQKASVALKNRILVMNLAFADLLIGVYLLVLGCKDATVDKYCTMEQEWRSSSVCTGLGTIVVIGTEASIMIMIIMTSYRLLLVFRPFQSQSMPSLVLAIGSAWTIAIVLATIPLSPFLTDYFLSCVWFRSHRYLGYACKTDIQQFTKKLITFEGADKLFRKALGDEFTWTSMLSAQRVLNDSYVPERYFGFYAAHSVCLPRFFPDRQNDQSWGYSLFLLLINFFGFVFILLSYIFIYRKSTSNANSAGNDDRAAVLQRKVTRIVMTDFCCWMPICVMAFLKVAGVNVDDIAYAVTAVILLPINSAMNPFLYSSLLDIIWKNFRPVRDRLADTSVGRNVGASVRYVRKGARKRDSVATSITNMPITTVGFENSEEKASPAKHQLKGINGPELQSVPNEI